MIRNRKLLKGVAMFLAVQMFVQTVLPTLSYALTSGPGQPEFSSFEPVATTNMVDEFTGDFTYNLPVLEVPGPQGSSYPISLSYHSGVTPEEEASWVGLGWTLNAGAVNRGTRGLPDDYSGQNITFHSKMPKNWTVSFGAGATFGEIFSADVKLGFNASLRYNNYRGFGYNKGVGLILGKGLVSLGYGVSDGQSSFSLDVSPGTILINRAAVLQGRANAINGTVKKSEQDLKAAEELGKTAEVLENTYEKYVQSNDKISLGSRYGLFSYNEFAKPANVSPYTGASFNISVGTQVNPSMFPIGATLNLSGNFSYQKTPAMQNVGAYGFMYSAQAQESGLMDYHLEKETDYNKRDVFLGVPFNDVDNFSMTGEGVMGGFRLHNKQAGHFSPQSISSGVTIFNVAGELGVGVAFGAGIDLGAGRQTLEMGQWNALTKFEDPVLSTADEPVFFRFNGDMGGEWGSNITDAPETASFAGRDPVINPKLKTYNNGQRSGRSSYIAYHRNEEMFSVAPGASKLFTTKSFNKNNDVAKQAWHDGADFQKLIGELSVTNESGSRYLYALPVYNRNEKQLNFSGRASAVGQSNIENNYIAFPGNYNPDNGNVKVGQEQNSPYASTFLLTEINTPDFVDLRDDGGTLDDLGGYTRFSYLKHGANWYKWRSPYRGYYYNKNSQSDYRDDQIGYSEGEKEIYYLNAIETKTHIAIFELGDRIDGHEAPPDPGQKTGTYGEMTLKYLKTIQLYTISDCELESGKVKHDATGQPVLKQNVKPIKTVHFKYNNTLCQGVPNSSSGKLTLERVYFEYNGITTSQISPYIFEYKYPDYTKYPAKYTQEGPDDVTQDFNALTVASQNPDYSWFNSDAWGNYQIDGANRFNKMRSWIDQKVDPNKDFDPAAWHLKVIKLPSGGEIHVQYEQDDYAFVQDQEVHAMAPLHNMGIDGDRFVVNTDALGIDSEGRIKMVNMINERYVKNRNKIYFKFLFSLLGRGINPDLEMCNADFISGYANVKSCSVITNGVLIVLEKSGTKIPPQVCQEFVKTQRLGMIDPDGNCSPGMAENDNDADVSKGEAAATVKKLSSMLIGSLTDDVICQTISPENSYMRVPLPVAKKGGGVRVKRLLTFDVGMEGEKVLFGNEYLYQTQDQNLKTISSGVATNEPSTIREENILVDFIARKNQSFASKLIAGKDLKQSEGPLGESILPGASVGYSKVIIRNIHSGKTSPGFSITEFNTAKDFPISLARPEKSGTMTDINSAPRDWRMSLAVLMNVVVEKTWVTQGFSFVLNDMHGKMKSSASYRGIYSPSSVTKDNEVSSTRYEYFAPGEKVPVASSIYGEISMENPGREADLTFAQKKVVEKSYDVNVEFDFHAAVLGIIVLAFPGSIPTMNFTEGALYSHATSKVIRYPAIVKRTTVMQDGIIHSEENVAFDRWTGTPVAVKADDEFAGAYLTQKIPASWEYKNYTAKYVTEGKTLALNSTPGQSLNFSYSKDAANNSWIKFGGDVGCHQLAQLATGDVLAFGNDYQYQVTDIDYSQDRVKIVPTKYNTTAGEPTNVGQITIVKSGRTNNLSETAGTVTFHNPNKDMISATALRQPDSQRYTKGDNIKDADVEQARDDGSLFVRDLNEAFQNRSNGPVALRGGLYRHMNMTQYAYRVPAACHADLADASIYEVNVWFKENNGNVSVELGSFRLQCDTGSEVESALVKIED